MSVSTVVMVSAGARVRPHLHAVPIGSFVGGDEWYRRGMTDAAGTISVRLFAGLELRARERRTAYELDPREVPTIEAVTGVIGLEPGAAGLVLVNGVHAGAGQTLGPGDEVALFPPLGGG